MTPSDYSTQLTITDADKETVYEGSVTGFRSYLFAENGTFDAKLVVTASDSAAEDRSSVTGTETWQFRFTVGIKPSVSASAHRRCSRAAWPPCASAAP